VAQRGLEEGYVRAGDPTPGRAASPTYQFRRDTRRLSGGAGKCPPAPRFRLERRRVLEREK
jgi:hypothetical protein